MSDEKRLERQLGKPLRKSLPPAPTDLDDEPLTARARRPGPRRDHWPDEEASVATAEGFSVTEGELLESLQWYFPLFWLACLIIVSYIGIYYAVDRISHPNPLPPAWF